MTPAQRAALRERVEGARKCGVDPILLDIDTILALLDALDAAEGRGADPCAWCGWGFPEGVIDATSARERRHG